MLGFSLEDRLQGCGGKFSAPTCVPQTAKGLRRKERCFQGEAGVDVFVRPIK